MTNHRNLNKFLKQNIIVKKLLIIIFTLISTVSWGETINSDNTYVFKGLYYKKGLNTPFTGTLEGNVNGKLIEGKREGVWEYFEDGKLVRRINYTNGFLNGLSEKFNLKGKFDGFTNWKYGKEHGKFETYINKKLYRKGTYKDGKLDGLFEEYDDGEISQRFEFKDGLWNGDVKYFYGNNQIGTHIQFKNGKEHGFWKEYYENGNIELFDNYINGKLHGLSESYYKNGNLKTKGYYVNGKPDGIHFTYSSDGKEFKKILYEKGVEIEK